MGSQSSMPTVPLEIAKVNKNAPTIYRTYNVQDHLFPFTLKEDEVNRNKILELSLEKFKAKIEYFVEKKPLDQINFATKIRLREETDKYFAVKRKLDSDSDYTDVIVDPSTNEKHIYMCRHYITSLNENVGALSHTQVLQACCNYITRIPFSIKNLVNLKMLILSRNRITVIPDELGCCKELRELDISNNLIEFIPNSIASLKNLTVLNISNNKLKEINPTVGKLTSLKNLYVDNNELEYLPLEVLKLPFLTQLTVENNQLNFDVQHRIEQVGSHTLLEECARNIVRNNLRVPRNLPTIEKEKLIAVRECAFCGGPFFNCFFEVYAVHEFDNREFPVRYRMCSKHYENHGQRLTALFASTHAGTKPVKLLEKGLPSVSELFEPFCHNEELMIKVQDRFDGDGDHMPLICLSMYNSRFFKKYVTDKSKEIENEEHVKKTCF